MASSQFSVSNYSSRYEQVRANMRYVRSTVPVNTENLPYYYVFDWEKSLIHEDLVEWFQDYWQIAFLFAGAYVFLLFKGREYMKDRPAYDVRTALVLWNLVLSAFSIIGTFRTWPEITRSVRDDSVYYSLCLGNHVRHNPVAGNWGMLFAFSKVFELGDTAFIVLRKQRLLFLHWYHHITVLLYAWYSYGQAIPTARYFITFNFLAHALMYPYYMMKALKIQVPRRIAMGVTLFQLSQMVVGVTVNTYAYLCIRAGMHCEVPMENIQVSFLMYLSYLILFAKFFIDAYVKRSLAKATKEYKAAVASGKPTANGHPTITEEFTDYLKIN